MALPYIEQGGCAICGRVHPTPQEEFKARFRSTTAYRVRMAEIAYYHVMYKHWQAEHPPEYVI